MRTFVKIWMSTLVLVFAYSTLDAQSTNKQLKKDLKSKVEKDCRKEAKRLQKEGWKVMPGKLSIERQIQEGRFSELNKDEDGNPLYFTATHQAKGGNYSAAQKIANDRARMGLAENISTTFSELVKEKLANTDYGEGDIETIDEFVSTNKNLVSLSLQGVLNVVEIYRESGNMVEVQVMVKVKMADALKAAKKAYGDKLRQKSEKLAKELDEIVKY